MYRFRRLRRDEKIRSIMQETRLHPKDFLYPIFVMEGEKIKNPVESMPGIYQYSIDCLDEILEQVKTADRGRFAISKNSIRRSILWWMCVCVNTLPMAIAG